MYKYQSSEAIEPACIRTSLLHVYAQPPHPRHTPPLRIIPWLVKNMIPVPSHTLSLKQRWEAHILRDLIFRHILAAAFRLSDHKFTDLSKKPMSATEPREQGRNNLPATPYQ